MRIQQSSSNAANPTYISLARLLARLDQKYPAGPTHYVPTSRPSAFEMAKLKANLEYANDLLHQLETDTSGFKNPNQRQKALSDLQPQRNTTKRLNDVLNALELLEDRTVINVVEELQIAEKPEEHAEPAIPTPSIASPKSQTTRAAPLSTAPVSTAIPSNEPASILRNRLGKPHEVEEKPALNLEDQLSHDRHEQDDLSESLVKMAEQLKANSRKFADDLESEKDVSLRDFPINMQGNTLKTVSDGEVLGSALNR
ncbi:hypothetical protein H072_2808 [Dactylellina haptotyla CBS 200.50]|uniref:Uncharacterized protein n=1 Tax=Dactylellina haptotyla (strain CBS 200.50) TaxID=1284197 RepID=S8BUQ2_DACHA|nr:hypothetical protein H072_2808 [Dactylellina haptotyla CBS 200.50]